MGTDVPGGRWSSMMMNFTRFMDVMASWGPHTPAGFVEKGCGKRSGEWHGHCPLG
jgi:hypothetical protein